MDKDKLKMLEDMNDSETETHQRVKLRVIQKLKQIGRYGESFSDVVERLCDEYEEQRK